MNGRGGVRKRREEDSIFQPYKLLFFWLTIIAPTNPYLSIVLLLNSISLPQLCSIRFSHTSTLSHSHTLSLSLPHTLSLCLSLSHSLSHSLTPTTQFSLTLLLSLSLTPTGVEDVSMMTGEEVNAYDAFLVFLNGLIVGVHTKPTQLVEKGKSKV